MATIDRKKYPPVSFYFKVKFIGIGNSDVDTRFQEVSGLTHEIGVEDLPEGGENRFSYKLPTKGKYGNLTLKRGVMLSSGLVDWINDAIDKFTFAPKDINITLLNETGQPLVSWNFSKAYPVKWSTSDLKSTDNSIVTETLELAYQSFTKSYPKTS
jgi:phage tail-like protein